MGGAGFTSSAIILEVRPKQIHIRYTSETELAEGGELISWWMIYEGNEQYYMRRNDWAETSKTNGRWKRCPNS